MECRWTLFEVVAPGFGFVVDEFQLACASVRKPSSAEEACSHRKTMPDSVGIDKVRALAVSGDKLEAQSSTDR